MHLQHYSNKRTELAELIIISIQKFRKIYIYVYIQHIQYIHIYMYMCIFIYILVYIYIYNDPRMMTNIVRWITNNFFTCVLFCIKL